MVSNAAELYRSPHEPSTTNRSPLFSRRHFSCSCEPVVFQFRPPKKWRPVPMTMKKRYPVCILATACIPWNEDFTFAEDLFRREVRQLLKGLTRHVYIFGTAGEGYAGTERQFDEICRAFPQ